MDNFPHPPTMFLVAGALVALVFILNRWLFGPLNEILGKRQAEIDEARARFEHAQRVQRERLEAVEARLSEARQEAFAIRERAQQAARARRDAVLAEARADAARQIEQAREQLRAEIDEARASLEARADELARAAAEKLLGRPLGGAEKAP